MPFKSKEAKRLWSAEYERKNKERRRAQKVSYFQENREEKLAKSKEHYFNNLERIKARQKRASLEIKQKAMGLYGGKCVNPYCDEKDLAALSIDHINNDGAKERREKIGKGRHTGERMYRELLKNGKRDDLQVLCMNCQFKKRAYGSDYSKWPGNTGVQL